MMIDSAIQKFDEIKQDDYPAEHSLVERSENSLKQQTVLSAENEMNLLTTTTTTVEVKVKTMKTSARKRKLNPMNQINNDNDINQQPAITTKKKNSRMTKIDPNDADDEQVKKQKTNDQSSVTDESSFGSCEPGTSVVLQGIVWNETDKGVLVVNITWRGKTYVGALLNTTEQHWAPPRYKSDIRSTKPNHQLTLIPSSHDSTERILRNGKRRGSNTTVTPSSTTKTRSFKIPETPVVSKKSDISSTNLPDEDETGDNDSSRSVSPTTSGISTTSSSPPLSTNTENQSTPIPMDLPSNSNDQQLKSKEPLIPYHFSNEMLFPSSDYFSSTNSFNLPTFNKLSATSATSSFLPITSQLYFNYPTVSSLAKSSH